MEIIQALFYFADYKAENRQKPICQRLQRLWQKPVSSFRHFHIIWRIRGNVDALLQYSLAWMWFLSRLFQSDFMGNKAIYLFFCDGKSVTTSHLICLKWQKRNLLN